MAPKLPCFNTLVNMGTNRYANKNKNLFRLAGSMDKFNFCMHGSVLFLSLNVHSKGAVVWGNLGMASSPYSTALGYISLLQRRDCRLISATVISFCLPLASLLCPATYGGFFCFCFVFCFVLFFFKFRIISDRLYENPILFWLDD